MAVRVPTLAAGDKIHKKFMPPALGWIDVTDHGAKGDGATDNAAAFAAAVAAMPAGKATLYIPPGNYRTSQPLNLNPNSATTLKEYVTVRGAGKGATVVTQTSSTADGIKAPNMRHFNIHGLSLYGPGRAVGSGVGLNHTSNTNPAGWGAFHLDINSVEVKFWGSHGVHTNYPIVSSMTMVNSEDNGGNGFCIEPTSTNDYGTSLTMYGCWGHRNNLAGYYIDKMNYMAMIGCATDGCGIGYDLNRIQGGVWTGCGTEAHRPNLAAGAKYKGTGMRINNSMSVKVDQLSAWDVRGPLIEVTGNSTRINIDGQMDGYPATENGATITYSYPSIQVDAGSTVEMRPSYSAGLKPPNVYAGNVSVWGHAGKVATLGEVDFAVTTAGKGLRIKEGTNAKQGTATLVGGQVVINNASIGTNSRVMLTCQSPGGTPGALYVSSRTAGASFTVRSSSSTDASFFAYEIFEPA